MAEWNPLSSFNEAGQPNTSVFGQDRMRVDPRNAYSGYNLPLQETGQPGIIEPDGFGSLPNFTISEDQVAVDQRVASVQKNDIRGRQSSETRNTFQPTVPPPNQSHHGPVASPGLSLHQQSASGFSHRINIPSDGHLWELPQSDANYNWTTQEKPVIPKSVAPGNFPQSSSTHQSVQRELRQLLGADQYAQRYRECYASHIFAGRNNTYADAYATHLLIDRNAVMCALCNYGCEGFPQNITHAPNCPVLQCLQRIANPMAVLQCLQRIANPMRSYQHSDQSYQRGSTWVMGNQVLIPRPEQDEHDNSNFVEHRPPTPFYTANNWQSDQARNSQIPNSNYSSNTGARPPVYQQYASDIDRYRTFDNLLWTSKQKPKKLAEAGLFYIGIADHCRCFYCGGLLRDWQDHDDPIVEHEKWFPNCLFIQELINVRPTVAASTRGQETRFQDVTEAFASLGIQEQESATFPNHLNPDICTICQQREIAVTQMHCGHIVCRACLPTPNAEGRYLCRLCGREVVRAAAIDVFCRRPHSQWQSPSSR